MTIKAAKQPDNAYAVTNPAITTADATAPTFANATVNGNQLIMTYSEALDAAHQATANAFTVKVGGVANTVTAVAVDAAAKTLTLTLSTAVQSNNKVTVAYTDRAGNNINTVQDASGNDARSFFAHAVINNTPDTSAPVFAHATVNGSTLVMTYSEALDASHAPAAGKFAVAVGGVANAVKAVAVNAVAKTVTLTLATAVSHDAAVTVKYTDPNGNDNINAIQDKAGNDALTLSAHVTNTTPDTTAPVFAHATVNGSTLVMTYSEALDASHAPAAGKFAVAVGGVANIVKAVVVNAAAKTVTLTLTTAVSHDAAVTVKYTDPNGNDNINAIQDKAGNDALTLSAHVTNTTPDTTAPVFAHATVNGSTLVMTYSEALDASHAPAAGKFAVAVGGVANVVKAVVVNAAAKTVTLTLTTAVSHDAAVTVKYTDPNGNNLNAIQDKAGNDALTLNAQVTNTTPDTTAPVFAHAIVNGSTLVMTYGEALDARHAPSAGKFAVAVDGVANVVKAVVVNAVAKTVTLTLTTAVAYGNEVSVAYTDLAGNNINAIQDKTGNDALSLAVHTVTNNTADTIAPVFVGATVKGSTLVMSYDEVLDASHPAAANAFAVKVGGVANTVKAVIVDAIAKTVTLTLTTPVLHGNEVTVAYTDLAGNSINAIQDKVGNDALSIGAHTVTNQTPIINAPLTFAIAETGTIADGITSNNTITVSGLEAGATWEYSLNGGTLYSPGTGTGFNMAADTRYAVGAIKVRQTDAAGNLSAVASNTTVIQEDSSAPVFATAVVNGSTLIMTYGEALDASHGPVAGNFAVTVGGVANAVTAVAIDSAAKTVTLTLSTAVTNGAAVTLAYTDPSVGSDANAVQDASGNDALSLAARSVTNNTPVPADTTAPAAPTFTINETGIAADGITSNNAITVSGLEAGATWEYSLNGGTLYSPGTGTGFNMVADTGYAVGAIKVRQTDAAGNLSAVASNTTVIQEDSSAPVFATAVVNGNTLVMTYGEALDASHGPIAGNFAVSVGGVANAVTAVALDSAAKTVTLTLSTAVTNGAAVTLAYTDPSVGNDANAVQDASGNDALSLAARSVTNNTPDPADTLAPVFAGAVVNGSTLVMTYGEALDASHGPVAGNFAVAVGGVANAVTAVAIDNIAKTVTLTLSTAVTNGAAVTVAYTDPSVGNDVNAVQDVSGNDALSLAARSVTNNTPILADTTAPAAPTFTITETGIAADGITSNSTITVSGLEAGATWEYSLNGGTLYNPGTGTGFNMAADTGYAVGAIKVRQTDAAGNLSAVASNTIAIQEDSTAPAALTLAITETGIAADGITSNNTITVSGVEAGATWEYSLNGGTLYSPGTGAGFNMADDTGYAVGAIKVRQTDAAGNLGAVTSNTAVIQEDSTAPAAPTFAITETGTAADGITSNNTITVSGLEVNATWEYSLNVGALYSAGTGTGFNMAADTDYAVGAIKVRQTDATGNLSAVASNTSPIQEDSTAPVFTKAVVNSSTLIMTYGEGLDASHRPVAGDFTVAVGGIANAVTAVAVDTAAKTVTLILTTAVTNGEAITVGYTDPSVSNDANAVQDASGNDALSIIAHAVTNNTPIIPDSTAPTISSVAFTASAGADNTFKTGDIITATATFSEGVTVLGSAPTLELDVGGVAKSATYVSGSGTATLVFNYTVQAGDTDTNGIAIAANKLVGTIKDAAGNAATLSHSAVTLDSTRMVDATAPTVTVANADNALKVGDTSVVTFTFSEAVTGFTASDVTVGNGSITTPTSTNGGLTWTATLTPTAATTAATNVITVAQTGVTDATGNAGTGTRSSANYALDTVRPTVTVANADNALKVGDTSVVTFTFSEAVTGFTAADVSVGNGSITAPVSTNGGLTWTATLTPTAATTAATNAISVDKTGVTDAAGNAGTGSTNSANYAVDTATPTVTVANADNALKVGDTSVVTFTFSEAVSGFTAADVSVGNGSITTPVSTNGGLTWTATLTPTAATTAASNVITVAQTGVTDASGNAGTGSTNSANYAVDTATPTVTVANADNALKVGDTSVVTFTFSEAVTGFTAADVSVGNGSITAPVSTNGGLTWTATLTPTAATTAATNVITVAQTGVTDASGNAGTGSTNSANYAVDTATPTVTVANADNALKVGDTSVVTFTFSEAVTGFTAADVSVGNGSITAPVSTNGGLTWTATLTPTAATTAATNVITVAQTGVSDAAGNAGTGSTGSANYAVDTATPTVTVANADNALKVGDTSVVTFTFSEAVSGFTAADVNVGNGNITAPVSTNGGLTWTATLTPTAATTAATNVITVAQTGVTDASGNAGTGSTNSANYAVDTATPTVTVANADNALKVGDTSVVTFTFSEAVTGFTAADVSVGNGSITTPASTDGGLTWTATLTPTAATTAATNVIGVDKTGVTDAAGNAGSGSTNSANYAVDTATPTITVVNADNALKVGDTSVVTFTFSEAVTGFTAADVSVGNGSITTPASTDGGLTWTATLTPTASTTAATNVIGVDKTGVTDAAGNAGTGSTNSANYAVDTATPTVTVVNADNALKVGDTSVVTFTFSEAVSGFTAADVSVGNGSITTPASTDGGLTWTATLTPTAATTAATNVIGVDKTGVTDAAGNAGTGSTNSANYAIDTATPTITVVNADNALKVGDTSVVTFTFSEAVTGFTAADVNVGNGTITTPASTDGGLTWTATLTPTTATTAATNVITVAQTGVTDAAGNAGTGSTNSANYAIDTATPTVTVTNADNALKVGDTSVVTFTFSEAVTGFTAADVSVGNGSITTPASTDGGLTWTATLTPSAATTAATNVISVDKTGVTDAAGNAGTGNTNSANYAVDTATPTVTVVNADNALKVGDTSVVTFTFSEAVSGFTAADVSVGNGNITTPASTDGGLTWTATLTPTAATTAATNAISVDKTGVTDAAGNAGIGSTNSANYAIDTATPTVTVVNADNALKVGDTSVVTFTFSEAVTGFTAADVSVGNGNITTPASTDGGLTWTATLTPTASTTAATNVISVDKTGVTDAAGNAGTGSTNSANYAIDTAAPSSPVMSVVATDDAVNSSEATASFNLSGTGEIGATVTVTLGSAITLSGGNTALVDSNGNWSVAVVDADVTAMGEGSESISATQTDTAGNVSAASLVKTISVAAGTAFTLIAGTDTYAGTVRNDTFTGAYDANTGVDTFDITDVLNGGAGTADTLVINHVIGGVAIAPPDALWTGISNIEKLVLNTSGAGAQTLTTGPFFEAAFHNADVAGVDLTLTTTGGGAIDLTMLSFHGSATLTTTSTDGAQTIQTSPDGVATVSATSGAGALNIAGVGLTTVVAAVTTGNGAQNIGGFTGSGSVADGGSHLTSVNATAAGGAQTIISTSTGDVTINATSGDGAVNITTGTGNDTISLFATTAAGANSITSGAGADTVNLYTNFSSVDTIVQANGDSNAMTVNTTSSIIATGETITFGNGLDIIHGFTGGVDHLDVGTPGAAVSGLGMSEIAFTAAKTVFLSGAYSGGVFTIADDATGADTLLLDSTATDDQTIATADTWILLVGTNSGTLDTNSFI